MPRHPELSDEQLDSIYELMATIDRVAPHIRSGFEQVGMLPPPNPGPLKNACQEITRAWQRCKKLGVG